MQLIGNKKFLCYRYACTPLVVCLIALTSLTNLPCFLIYALFLGGGVLFYFHLLNSLFLLEYNFFYTFLIYAHFFRIQVWCRTRPRCILCMYLLNILTCHNKLSLNGVHIFPRKYKISHTCKASFLFL